MFIVPNIIVFVLRLSDGSDNAILKLADFGLSAVMFAAEESSTSLSTPDDLVEQKLANMNMNSLSNGAGIMPPKYCGNNNMSARFPDASGIRRFRSVVGSPHYVAPEVTLSGAGNLLLLCALIYIAKLIEYTCVCACLYSMVDDCRWR